MGKKQIKKAEKIRRRNDVTRKITIPNEISGLQVYVEYKKKNINKENTDYMVTFLYIYKGQAARKKIFLNNFFKKDDRVLRDAFKNCKLFKYLTSKKNNKYLTILNFKNKLDAEIDKLEMEIGTVFKMA